MCGHLQATRRLLSMPAVSSMPHISSALPLPRRVFHRVQTSEASRTRRTFQCYGSVSTSVHLAQPHASHWSRMEFHLLDSYKECGKDLTRSHVQVNKKEFTNTGLVECDSVVVFTGQNTDFSKTSSRSDESCCPIYAIPDTLFYMHDRSFLQPTAWSFLRTLWVTIPSHARSWPAPRR